MRWHRDNGDSMQQPIVVEPAHEDPPTSIMDTLGQVPVADHVADLKVLIGNQVVRRDQRVCLFAGKIFALPVHLQIAFRQCCSGLLAIG